MHKTQKILLSLVGAITVALTLVLSINLSTYELEFTGATTAETSPGTNVADEQAIKANSIVAQNLGPGQGSKDGVSDEYRATSTTGVLPSRSPSPAPTRSIDLPSPAEPDPAAMPAGAPAEAAPSPPAVDDYVHPGAWCARKQAGAHGYSKNGVPMTCTYEGEDQPRWRAS